MLSAMALRKRGNVRRESSTFLRHLALSLCEIMSHRIIRAIYPCQRYASIATNPMHRPKRLLSEMSSMTSFLPCGIPLGKVNAHRTALFRLKCVRLKALRIHIVTGTKRRADRLSLNRRRGTPRVKSALRGDAMKSTILAAVGALALAESGSRAINNRDKSGPKGWCRGNDRPEQRAKIKQYVVQHQVRSYPMQQRIAVGTTLPAEVELISRAERMGSWPWWL